MERHLENRYILFYISVIKHAYQRIDCVTVGCVFCVENLINELTAISGRPPGLNPRGRGDNFLYMT